MLDQVSVEAVEYSKVLSWKDKAEGRAAERGEEGKKRGRRRNSEVK